MKIENPTHIIVNLIGSPYSRHMKGSLCRYDGLSELRDDTLKVTLIWNEREVTIHLKKFNLRELTKLDKALS